jgi:hypothetical protein
MPAVFLTHASPPPRIAADSELSTRHLSGHVEIVGCEGGKRFNRRVSISVICCNAPNLNSFDAPKLTAGAAGIESERYDFDKISLVTFFLGKKVTPSVRIP